MRFWKRVDAQGNTTTVESYSHEFDVKGAIEISKTEFDSYVASLPKPVPIPVRDYGEEIDALSAEIDDLKARIERLEKR